MATEISLFCDVKPCNPVNDYQRHGRTNCLLFQGGKVKVLYKTTRCYFQECVNLHSYNLFSLRNVGLHTKTRFVI
jgi:hypothetical protein